MVRTRHLGKEIVCHLCTKAHGTYECPHTSSGVQELRDSGPGLALSFGAYVLF